jgi:hypothetical protein
MRVGWETVRELSLARQKGYYSANDDSVETKSGCNEACSLFRWLLDKFVRGSL